jgi:hypothetical protein
MIKEATMSPNYRQIMAIKKANEDKIRKMCPIVTEDSGIYLFWRIDSDGFKFAYVGQAKNLLKRLAEHLSGYQHIDLSIKKHKFYDEETNPYGYHVEIICHCPEDELDGREQYWIKHYADQGYQLRNATTGSQGSEKRALGDGKSNKGYRDGLVQGRKNTQKEIKELFDKYLTYDIKGKPGKIKQRKYDEFTAFLNEGNVEEEDEI